MSDSLKDFSHVRFDSDMNFEITPLTDKIASMEAQGFFDSTVSSAAWLVPSQNPQHEVPGAVFNNVGFKGTSFDDIQSAEFVMSMTDGQSGSSKGGEWPMTDEMSNAASGLNRQVFGVDYILGGSQYRLENSPFVIFQYMNFQNDLSSGRVTGEGHFS